MREITIELTDEEYVMLDLWARNSKRTIEGQAAHIVVKNSKPYCLECSKSLAAKRNVQRGKDFERLAPFFP